MRSGAPLAFPLRTPPRCDRGPHLAPNLGAGGTTVNARSSTPVDNPVYDVWIALPRLWNTLGKPCMHLWGTRPDLARRHGPDQRVWSAVRCG